MSSTCRITSPRPNTPPPPLPGLEYLGAATSLMLPTDRLREAGREVGRQIAEQVEASEEVQQVVSRLETRYDEKAEGTVRRSLLADENDELPERRRAGRRRGGLPGPRRTRGNSR